MRRYEEIGIDLLIPYEKNARTHDDAQVEKIAKSIKEYGFINPVLIDENYKIIAGHGRLMGAKKLGLATVPCLFVEDLTEEQKKAYIIADNRLALDAGWDFEILKDELLDLESMNFDLSLTGFGDDELLEILEIEEEPQEVEEDDFDIEPPAEPKAKLGDIYQLGNHRLMCGSATSFEDIEALLNNSTIDLIYTDPPYGMNAVSKSGVLSETYKTDIMNDDDNTVAIDSFNLCSTMFNNVKQIWWGANYYTECLPSSECWIVWDKNNGASDQTDCELAWANFRSVVRQFTMASEKVNRVHPTQKPCKLFNEIIRKFDKNNEFDNVLDLFGGSGSTLIACEQMKRKSYIMELDPKYVDVIIERWETFTGKKAVLLNG